MAGQPNGDLLTLIWSELKLLPPDQMSSGVSVVITCPPEGDEGVGAVGVTVAVYVRLTSSNRNTEIMLLSVTP